MRELKCRHVRVNASTLIPSICISINREERRPANRTWVMVPRPNSAKRVTFLDKTTIEAHFAKIPKTVGATKTSSYDNNISIETVGVVGSTGRGYGNGHCEDRVVQRVMCS